MYDLQKLACSLKYFLVISSRIKKRRINKTTILFGSVKSSMKKRSR